MISNFLRRRREKKLRVYETALDMMVEKILLNHRRHGHQYYLISSAVPGEGVSVFCRYLSRRLQERSGLKTGLFYYDGQGEQTPSEARKQFNEEKSGYEILLVDVGSVFSNNNSFAFLDLCDAAILVVRAAQTDRSKITRAVADLRNNGLEVVGLVLNGYKEKIPALLLRFLR